MPRGSAIRTALAYSREHAVTAVRVIWDHSLIGEARNGIWSPTAPVHHPSCAARYDDAATCICPKEA